MTRPEARCVPADVRRRNTWIQDVRPEHDRVALIVRREQARQVPFTLEAHVARISLGTHGVKRQVRP